jgi:hypothetical protein
MQASNKAKAQAAHALSRYQAYITKLPVPAAVKAAVSAEDLHQSSYFLFYPELFSPAFPGISQQQLDQLCIAGYLYYRSVLYIDKIVDAQAKEGALVSKFFSLSLLCQEESVKILASIYPLDDPFWITWNQRKCEYLKAQEKDKEDFYNWPVQSFYNLADYKSAFGKVAVDCLFLLQSKPEHQKAYDQILLSHAHFSIGRQLYDDIIDIKEDFANGQANYALYKLRQACQANEIDFDSFDELYLEKYLYVLGVSETILQESQSHYNHAIDIAASVLPEESLWFETIRAFMKITKLLIIKQSTYLKQIRAKLDHSDKPLGKAKRPSVTLIENRLEAASGFLLKKLQAGGYWEEYINSAGTSNCWATGFVASFVTGVNGMDGVMERGGVKTFLSSYLNKDFAYNDIAPRDGDSTNFGLLALTGLGVDVAPKVNDWLQYQHSDGGFSTYIANDRMALGELMGMEHEPDFGFWELPQQCVSAVSLFTMHKLHGLAALHPRLEALTQYMINSFKDDVWEAYWWTSPVYTSSFVIKAAFEGDSESLKIASTRAIHQLQRAQQRTGGWGDAFVKESPFYTGLMTDALCSNPQILQANRDSVKAGVHWILDQQMSDGSWAGSDAMRLPAFRTKDLNSIANWPIRRKSLNVRSAEFNRVFSTAVCMAALNGYAKRGL